MLRLMYEGEIIAEAVEGARIDLPNGDLVQPAYAGWRNDDGYSLEAAPPPSQQDLLLAERGGMRAYRLAFEDAAAETAFGAGTLLGAIDALLAASDPMTRRRYANITIFERLRPEIAAFLQNPAGINLSDEQVDQVFRLAMTKDA